MMAAGYAASAAAGGQWAAASGSGQAPIGPLHGAASHHAPYHQQQQQQQAACKARYTQVVSEFAKSLESAMKCVPTAEQFILPASHTAAAKDASGRSTGAGASKGTDAAKARRGPIGTSSRFRGVTRHRRTKRWEAHIWAEKKQVYLGGFDDEEAAAKAHDVMALKCRGTATLLNFCPEFYGDLLVAMPQLTREDVVKLLRRQSRHLAKKQALKRLQKTRKGGAAAATSTAASGAPPATPPSPLSPTTSDLSSNGHQEVLDDAPQSAWCPSGGPAHHPAQAGPGPQWGPQQAALQGPSHAAYHPHFPNPHGATPYPPHFPPIYPPYQSAPQYSLPAGYPAYPHPAHPLSGPQPAAPLASLMTALGAASCPHDSLHQGPSAPITPPNAQMVSLGSNPYMQYHAGYFSTQQHPPASLNVAMNMSQPPEAPHSAPCNNPHQAPYSAPCTNTYQAPHIAPPTTPLPDADHIDEDLLNSLFPPPTPISTSLPTPPGSSLAPPSSTELHTIPDPRYTPGTPPLATHPSPTPAPPQTPTTFQQAPPVSAPPPHCLSIPPNNSAEAGRLLQQLLNSPSAPLTHPSYPSAPLTHPSYPSATHACPLPPGPSTAAPTHGYHPASYLAASTAFPCSQQQQQQQQAWGPQAGGLGVDGSLFHAPWSGGGLVKDEDAKASDMLSCIIKHGSADSILTAFGMDADQLDDSPREHSGAGSLHEFSDCVPLMYTDSATAQFIAL